MKRAIAIVGLALIASSGYASGRLTLAGVPGQWWSPMAAAKWSGVICGGFGGLAGLLGALAGVLAQRGKGRQFVMSMWTLFLSVSVITLVIGFVALVSGQHFWVYTPLLLTGFIGTAVMGPLTLVVRRAYDLADERKMNALDAGQ